MEEAQFRRELKREARRRLRLLVPDNQTTVEGQLLRDAGLGDDEEMRTTVLQCQWKVWLEIAQLASSGSEPSGVGSQDVVRELRDRMSHLPELIVAKQQRLGSPGLTAHEQKRLARSLAADLGAQKAYSDMFHWARKAGR